VEGISSGYALIGGIRMQDMYNIRGGEEDRRIVLYMELRRV